MKVVLERGESAEYLVKRFMRKFKKSDIMKTILERRFFKTETSKKKEKTHRRLVIARKIQEENKWNIEVYKVPSI